MNPRLLIVCFNDLKNDARVSRQINFLKDHYNVSVFCYDAYPDPGYELIKIKKTRLTLLRKAALSVFLMSGLYSVAYRLLYNYHEQADTLSGRDFHIVIANDVEALPIARKVAGDKSKIFLDAHEYAPRQFEDRLYWRIFFKRFTLHLCRKFLPMVHGMSTINAGLANAYETEFNIKPVIITNATHYADVQPLIRDSYPIRLVHHGIFTISRQPDLMIDLMNLLDDRFTLDLIYLIPDSASQKTRANFKYFKSKASGTGKIKILPPLKGSEIVSTLHKNYDMGIILVPPVNFNYENGLPNKLFDCIQARLGMAVGPLREIANVTIENRIGVVSKDFTAKSLAEALEPLTIEQVSEFKKNSNAAARRLNAEANRAILLDALRKIT